MIMTKKYLLDTNICIFCLRGQYHITEKIERTGIANCYLSEITVAELYYGAEHSHYRERTLRQTEAFISLFDVVPSSTCLHAFGKIKHNLAIRGMKIENFDLMIGACAVANNMVLVTDNLRHMERIPDITIQNWKGDWPN